MVWRRAVNDPFFGKWIQRFDRNRDKYITPDAVPDPKVHDAAEWVRNNFRDDKGKSQKPWKTPKEMLESGSGDCEDRAFLLSSIWKKRGERSSVCVGYAHYPKQPNSPHVWNEKHRQTVDSLPGDKPLKYDVAYRRKI